MTKEQIQNIMRDASRVTMFLDDDRIHYMAGRTRDGSDEMIEVENGSINTEFMDNIIKQVAKQCAKICYESDHSTAKQCAWAIEAHFGVE